jgi:hypothetical protein
VVDCQLDCISGCGPGQLTIWGRFLLSSFRCNTSTQLPLLRMCCSLETYRGIPIPASHGPARSLKILLHLRAIHFCFSLKLPNFEVPVSGLLEWRAVTYHLPSASEEPGPKLPSTQLAGASQNLHVICETRLLHHRSSVSERLCLRVFRSPSAGVNHWP